MLDDNETVIIFLLLGLRLLLALMVLGLDLLIRPFIRLSLLNGKVFGMVVLRLFMVMVLGFVVLLLMILFLMVLVVFVIASSAAATGLVAG